MNEDQQQLNIPAYYTFNNKNTGIRTKTNCIF